jgi:hypothetical protein
MMDLDRKQEYNLKAQIKNIILDCNKHHRRGDAGFSPLHGAISALVRATVGEARWAQAGQELNVMLLQRRQQYLS